MGKHVLTLNNTDDKVAEMFEAYIGCYKANGVE